MKKLVLILMITATPASAYTVRGIGGSSCTLWNNGQGWDAKMQWAYGFVSGAESILLPQITAGTQHVDNNTLIQAVTAWCKQNPRSDIADATAAAVAAMQGR